MTIENTGETQPNNIAPGLSVRPASLLRVELPNTQNIRELMSRMRLRPALPGIASISAICLLLGYMLPRSDQNIASAAAEAFATPRPSPSLLAATGEMPSQQAYDQLVKTLTEYQVDRFRVVGTRVAGIVTDKDKKKYIFQGNVNEKGELVDQFGIEPPFFPIEIAVHPQNPEQIVVVGDRERRANEGKMLITNNGLKDYTVLSGGGTTFSVEYTADGGNLLVGSIGANDIMQNGDNTPQWSLVNPNTGTSSSLKCIGDGCGADIMTSSIMSGTQMVSYGLVPLWAGYAERILDLNSRTITTTMMNGHEGISMLRPVQYLDDENRPVIWLANNSIGGIPPNPPTTRTGTYFVNVGAQNTEVFQPNMANYPSDVLVGVQSAAVSLNLDRGFIGVRTDKYVKNVLTTTSFVEWRRLSALTDYAQSGLVPNDGSWISSTGIADMYISGMETLRNTLYGKEYLLVALSGSSEQCDTATNTCRLVLESGGLEIRDITGDVLSRPWSKFNLTVSLAEPTATPTPTISATATPGVTFTPTPTPINTATVTSYRVAIPNYSQGCSGIGGW